MKSNFKKFQKLCSQFQCDLSNLTVVTPFLAGSLLPSRVIAGGSPCHRQRGLSQCLAQVRINTPPLLCISFRTEVQKLSIQRTSLRPVYCPQFKNKLPVRTGSPQPLPVATVPSHPRRLHARPCLLCSLLRLSLCIPSSHSFSH